MAAAEIGSPQTREGRGGWDLDSRAQSRQGEEIPTAPPSAQLKQVRQ